MDAREALFIISVAARLVDMHPSTLRKYERCGLLEPCRQGGRLRLYSPRDIHRLRQIKNLVEDNGVNLAGVEMALALTDRVERLQRLCTDTSGDGPASSPRANPDPRLEGSPDSLRAEVRALAAEMLEILGAEREVGESDGTNRRSRQTETARGSER
ncbi:MAG TPA: MerR family transcriptional regulator [Chloroflexota bacterium]|nr:MerR family transcriptional regulator [Chloroflexota bacterium]